MIDGKIILLKTVRVNEIMSDTSLQFLRKLTHTDPTEWWLSTEQVVALSHIEKVQDGDGRSWVQNQTLLIPIHDYIRLTRDNFTKYFEPILNKLPEIFEPINPI